MTTGSDLGGGGRGVGKRGEEEEEGRGRGWALSGSRVTLHPYDETAEMYLTASFFTSFYISVP